MRFLGFLSNPVFKSRRFISAFVALIVMLIVAYVPEFQDMEADLVSSITLIAIMLIGGYSLQDAVSEWRKNPDAPQQARTFTQKFMDEVEKHAGVDIPDKFEETAADAVENLVRP